MPDLFLLRLVAAFVVGAVWITAASLIAERSGSLGGTIAGLPSTSVVAFLFIGFNQSPIIASEATTDFPLAISITGLFLVFYAVLALRGFKLAFVGALVLWFLLESVLALLQLNNYAISLVGCAAIFTLGYYVLAKRAKPIAEQITPEHRHLAVLWRALLSGSIVTSAVIASQLGGPLLGGVASAFPAVYSSTLIITRRTMGLDFSRSITKPLLLSTAITTIPYTTALRYLYLSLGLGLGTILAYTISIPFGYLAYRLDKRRQKRLT